MKELVLSEEQIAQIVKKLGDDLTLALKDEKKIPVALVVMRGAMNFAADLVRNIKRNIFIDYIQIASYEGTSTDGVIHLLKDCGKDLEDRTVIIIEDIVDTGYSMEWLVDHIKNTKHAKKVIVTALFDKPLNRQTPVQVDYCGHVLDSNKFLVGYGLDYNGIGRNIPYVFIPTEDEVKAWDKELKEE